MSARTARARGFTLIELMIVVSIIGILASMAIPTFQKFTLRAKSAERTTIMLRLKQQVQEYYVRTGSAVPPGTTGTFSTGYNPAYPPSLTKRPLLTNMANWNAYFSNGAGGSSIRSEIEGALYYSYYMAISDGGGSSRIWIWSAGDLDGDSQVSWKDMWWDRQNGQYNLTYEYPAEAVNGIDDTGPYRTF